MGLGGYGYPGDVNNSIPSSSAYPGGRTASFLPRGASRSRFRTNSAGELGGVNQGRYPRAAANPAQTTDVSPEGNGGIVGQPIGWWLVWLAIFAVFLWVARKYGGGGGDNSRYGNILPSFYNGVFLTLYIVLILNVLKVGARKFPIPGLSELILAA